MKIFINATSIDHGRTVSKKAAPKMAPPNANFGEMKESFIALNVHACEVSCRAGTIKCSRVRFMRARKPRSGCTGNSVPPLTPPKRRHSADKNCNKKL